VKQWIRKRVVLILSTTHLLIGRVGSLLEVGTMFHPELTGRENIYFNGAIQGMAKQEIERRRRKFIGMHLYTLKIIY